MSTLGIRKAVERLEVRIRAYHAFLKDWSHSDSAPVERHPGIQQPTTAEVETVENLVIEYAKNLTGAPPLDNIWMRAHPFCLANYTRDTNYARNEADYFRWFLMWIEKTKTYLEYLDGGDERQHARDAQSRLIHFTYIAEAHVGDKIQGISNATIVNRSLVESSFNSIKESMGEDAAQALLKIAEHVEASNNKAAGVVFDQFSKEIQNPEKDKKALSDYWDNLVQLVPDIATIGTATAKLISMFS